MIDRNDTPSISPQAKLLGISRGSVYYLPQGVNEAELAVMRQLDDLQLEHPFMGARQPVRQPVRHVVIERDNQLWALDLTYIPCARALAKSRPLRMWPRAE